MFNFIKIYEFFFKKAFNVQADTELVRQFRNDWRKYALIIKRSWIFWLYSSLPLVLMLLLTIANIYLAIETLENKYYQYVVIGFLVFSIVFSLFSSIRYLVFFRNISGEKNQVVPLKELEEKLEHWDKLFVKFFNQATFNYFMFIGLIISQIVNFWIHLYSTIILGGKWIIDTLMIIWYWCLDIWLLWWQSYLIARYRKKMIDLEMDFNVVVKGKIYFVNQSNMISNRQTIDGNKIKTIRSSYPSKLLAFFGVGNIDVLTEWDQWGLGTMSLYFVKYPDETVSMISKALDGNFEWDLDKYKNEIFNSVLKSNGYSVEKFYWWETNIETIKQLFKMKHIEEMLQNRFKNWGFEEQREIREIYEVILK